ncbi:hypothetical protein [Burkholderia sp. BCC0044]|uniref:hypothetical protein n=1 Tax=Burkholderia sp. BCC0044 TaxID=2676295 RepID=UPI001FC7CD15|nr:hypothetical protein [Burkholderia sp. BCC0044]
MTQRASDRQSLELQRRVLLARMAATRAELSASSHVIDTTQQSSARVRARHPSASLPTLYGSTGISIAVALVGLAALGPRRLVATAVRAGLVALIGRMTRDIVRQAFGPRRAWLDAPGEATRGPPAAASSIESSVP